MQVAADLIPPEMYTRSRNWCPDASATNKC